MSGNYVVQTQSKIVEGSMLALEGTELQISKVYNKTDTNYFLTVSKILKYQTIDGGLAPRRIQKGSSMTLLLEGDTRVNLTALQDVLESKESKKVGSLNMKEHRHTFKALYHLTKDVLESLSTNKLQAMRITMLNELGNTGYQDIEIREKSTSDLSALLKCIIPQFYTK